MGERDRIDRVLIIHPDAATRRSIEQTLRRIGGTLSIQEAATPTEGLQKAGWTDPRVILVDLCVERSLALEVARALRRSGRRIVGLYDPLLPGEASVEVLREAARAGFSDFVPLPASEFELRAALGAPAEPAEGAAQPAGRLVTFISHKGGVGTTTLACSTAICLADSKLAGDVALCDAVLQFGSTAAYLGLTPDRDLFDLVRDLGTVGAVSAYLTRHAATGLFVLAGVRDPLEGERIEPEQWSRALLELRKRFTITIVDAPARLDAMTLSLLDLSETIFVVTEAVSPVVVGTRGFLRLLADQGFRPPRVKVVLNRQGPAEGLLKEGMVAGQIERPIEHVVPFDNAALVAVSRGVPLFLLRNKGDYVKAITGLADSLAQSQLQPLQRPPQGAAR